MSQQRRGTEGSWRDDHGWHVAHLAGHALTVRQVEGGFLEISIDGCARRWAPRGKQPVRDAERELMAMIRGLSRR